MQPRRALPDDIKELMRLVREGKLFAVQKWIAEGKPVIPPEPYWHSPFRVAVEIGFHSMIEVFLQHGVAADERNYMLNQAVSNSKFEIIKLLVEYGADIHTVDFVNVCETGHPLIIHYFLDHGIDAETEYPFAQALRFPKRCHLGVFMKYRDKIPSFRHQLNLALRYHARNRSLKWVCLLLWAGGDPRLLLPDIGKQPDPESDTTAIEEAVTSGKIEIVEKIGFDPKRDNLDRMLRTSCLLGHHHLIEKLLALGANPNGAGNSLAPLEMALFHLWSEMEGLFGSRSEARVMDALVIVVRLADLGARWGPDKTSTLRRIRKQFYHYDARFCETIVSTFYKHKVCTPAELLKFISPPNLKAHLGLRYDELKKLLKSKPETMANKMANKMAKKPEMNRS